MRVAAFFVTLIAILSGHAAGACSEPSAPYCATKYGSFDDQDEFDRCRREMSSYKDDTEELLACLRRESEDLKRKSDSMLNEYNDTVESFNRRARG